MNSLTDDVEFHDEREGEEEQEVKKIGSTVRDSYLTVSASFVHTGVIDSYVKYE